MNEKKQRGVAYVDSKGLQVFVENEAKVSSVAFPKDTIQDLEVINAEKADSLLISFLDANKIPHALLTVVLSGSMFFAKDISDTDHFLSKGVEQDVQPDGKGKKTKELEEEKEKERKEIIKTYIGQVPLDAPMSKTIKREKGVKVVVTNRDLIAVLRQSFTKGGFTIGSIVPFFAFGDLIHLENGLTVDNARVALANGSQIKDYNILEEEVPIDIPQENRSSMQPDKNKNKRLFILIGIFVVLAVILGIVIFLFTRPSKTKQEPTLLSPSKTQSLAPSIAVSASASATVFDKKGLKIKLINDNTLLTKANILSVSLTQKGFRSIERELSTTTSPRTIVIIKSDVPSEAREDILAEISKNSKDVLVQESNEIAVDVIVAVGRL